MYPGNQTYSPNSNNNMLGMNSDIAYQQNQTQVMKGVSNFMGGGTGTFGAQRMLRGDENSKSATDEKSAAMNLMKSKGAQGGGS